MRIYNKKHRHIDLSLKELYKQERSKHRANLQAGTKSFGSNLVRGEYNARVILFLVSIAVIIGFSLIPLNLSLLIDGEKVRAVALAEKIEEEHRIFKEERNIVIKSDNVDRANEIATYIAVIQNKYIISIYDGIEDVRQIDAELEHTNYLHDFRENCSWINMQDFEAVRNVMLTGDYYWVGYADNSLYASEQKSISVFFILYDSGYPVQIIEYDYDVKNELLRSRKDWG